MGETRVRKTKKATEEVVRSHQNTKLPKMEKLKLEDSLAREAILEPPGSAIESTSRSSPPSKASAEHLESITDPDTVYIEVKNTETKGQAIFATRKIQPGTLILSETPLIRLTQGQEDNDKTTQTKSTPTTHPSFEAAFTLLPRPLQKAYLKLFDSQKSSFTRTASIYYSNCYNLTLSTSKSQSSPGGSCIGLTASRINHSCIPNVQFSFLETNNKMLFHAIKPIPRGKEILSTYDSVYALRAARQQKQMMYYGFRCDCESCEMKTEFWARSDERRKGMVEAKRTVKDCEKVFEEDGGGVDEAWDALERLERLLVKEGLVGLPLADVYRSMAKWAERKGDEKGVKDWRRKELDVCRICFGEGAPRVVALRARLDGID